MASIADEDPFEQVKSDVLAQLATTRPLFESYLRIRSMTGHGTGTTPSASTSPELTAARADLERALAALADDLADLDASVRAVEHDPAQYGLSAGEVARRRRVVQEAGGEVERMRRGALASTGVVSADLPDPNTFDPEADPNPNTFDPETDPNSDAYAAFARDQQLQLLREQDQHLDGVFQTVGTLRRQADDMGRELEVQNEMLQMADQLADRVGGRLQTGMAKLQRIARQNEDRMSSCCIGVLIVVLIVLLVLLLVL